MRKLLLVAYSCGSTFVPTTLAYIKSFKQYADWDVHYVHVTDQAEMDFDFSGYDALFQGYCARLCFEGYVSPSYIEAARRFRGVKVLAVQDEYDFTQATRAAAASIGFDIFLTCVPEDRWERVYPRAQFPNTEFMRVLTGYVPDGLAERGAMVKPLGERRIMIGYRGRDIGGRYGRLAFDKLEIGRAMREICLARGLPFDIAWSEESRIYGEQWFEFLGDCRATLATESGSDIFDFDGSIASAFAAMKRRLGRDPSFHEFAPHTRELEGQIAMGQVSPRVFEAAAMRTPLIMFEGTYSGVVQPGVHYIALKKDFSTIDDVLRQLDDLPSLDAMAARAHADLVASGRYSYRAFVATVMSAIERHLPGKDAAVSGKIVAAHSDAMLEARITTATLLRERPTDEPLSRDWYRIATASRMIGAVREGTPKLLAWAQREVAQQADGRRQRKAVTLAELEQAVAIIDQSTAGRLKAAYAAGSAASHEEVIALCRREYELVQSEIVAIVVQGMSAIGAELAVLRAPWVAGDVPRLRAAKRLKDGINKPILRRAWTIAQRLAGRAVATGR